MTYRTFQYATAIAALIIGACVWLGAETLPVTRGTWTPDTLPVPWVMSGPNNGIWIDFPQTGLGVIGGLFTKYEKPMSGSIVATFAVQTTGRPDWSDTRDPSNTCPFTGGKVSLQIAAQGWNDPAYPDYSARINPPYPDWYANGRWFSNPVAYTLTAGWATVQLTVQLLPDQWQNVYGLLGVQEPEGFANALRHPTRLGFVFGNRCFAGHGLSVGNGSAARFTLLSFQVTNR